MKYCLLRDKNLQICHLTATLIFLAYCSISIAPSAGDQSNLITNNISNISTPITLYKTNQLHTLNCQDGLIFKAWKPQTNLTTSVVAGRGMCYFLALVYLIIGVSIACDRFMEAIEVITAQEKKVYVRQNNGDMKVFMVRIWNDTVANITLMALGSSAPEIMLALIEMFGKNFSAGDLGPAVPDGESRKIKHLNVFFVTATWSTFAYIWLYMILVPFSRGRIDIWEGVVTLIFLPITVWTAYLADRRLFVFKYFGDETSQHKLSIVPETDKELESSLLRIDESDKTKGFEEARREYIATLKRLRKTNPQCTLWQLETMAHEQLIIRESKSRAFYRVKTSYWLFGRGSLLNNDAPQLPVDLSSPKTTPKSVDVHVEDEETTVHVFFEPGHYTVMESIGTFDVHVVRRGDLSMHTTVDYQTENGAAIAEKDFIAKEGTLIFPPGVDEQRIKIEIIDNDEFENDEHFYVRLSNPSEPAVLTTPKIATIIILDDDHSGIFSFKYAEHKCSESVGVYELEVKRYYGKFGDVIVPYWTEDGTAQSRRDYMPVKGELLFEDDQLTDLIPIKIVDGSNFEKDVYLTVNLGAPYPAPNNKLEEIKQKVEGRSSEQLTEEERLAVAALPRLGEITKAKLYIVESKEFRNTVNRFALKATIPKLYRKPVHYEPMRTEQVEQPLPSGVCFYTLQFLTIFWKIIFVFIPPAYIGGGYACFFASLGFIAMITALIGDVASHFGCTLGIKDSVTAICIVALGTSIPDTFVSKIAAMQDKYADASIGNVTGSNAVNVFLGIGLAWTVAAIYQYKQGRTFDVVPDTIAFSVAVYTIEALIAGFVLLIRRKNGGELGGPIVCKYISSGIFLFLWIAYLFLSVLEAYHIIEV
ncbi:sodium/calcium exchanger 3-like isoform X2 [Teleopsis dalmanni]|uniref:sodium/calcium exchanger 3-like isoform X2 n=1 Tax=Teleopsis dalmanni TaxID=139649 RepID=UPI0018CFBFEF|nr:sodium/calcium exchanger 3-like isoform X2 [Teleopsis dalmanni]